MWLMSLENVILRALRVYGSPYWTGSNEPYSLQPFIRVHERPLLLHHDPDTLCLSVILGRWWPTLAVSGCTVSSSTSLALTGCSACRRQRARAASTHPQSLSRCSPRPLRYSTAQTLGMIPFLAQPSYALRRGLAPVLVLCESTACSPFSHSFCTLGDVSWVFPSSCR